MAYNMSLIAENSTNVVGMLQAINTNLMFGWLGILFLIGTTAVMFMAFIGSTGDSNKAFSAASFNAFVIAIFLSALDLLSPGVLMITLIIAGATIAFTWKQTNV